MMEAERSTPKFTKTRALASSARKKRCGRVQSISNFVYSHKHIWICVWSWSTLAMIPVFICIERPKGNWTGFGSGNHRTIQISEIQKTLSCPIIVLDLSLRFATCILLEASLPSPSISHAKKLKSPSFMLCKEPTSPNLQLPNNSLLAKSL